MPLRGTQMLCISVKLKNLKANHNNYDLHFVSRNVVYIRKVKKSESKSQHNAGKVLNYSSCVYP